LSGLEKRQLTTSLLNLALSGRSTFPWLPDRAADRRNAEPRIHSAEWRLRAGKQELPRLVDAWNFFHARRIDDPVPERKNQNVRRRHENDIDQQGRDRRAIARRKSELSLP
jgi:hypothetical protein